MTVNFNQVSRHTGLAGVTLLCVLTAVSCTKKNEDNTQTDDPDVVVTEDVEEIVVACDDQIAIAKLNQSVRDTLTSHTNRLLSTYSARAGVNTDMNGVTNLVDSILIDVASPTEVKPANANGMVTCNASLSMTLPNDDMNRAKEVYQSLGGTSLNQTLASQNITVNNNMLVSKNFSYVVGMQGGQTTAKIVGEPEILSAVADIAAKSRLKLTLDENRPVIQSRPRTPTPIRPQPAPKPAPVPKPTPQPTQQLDPTPSTTPDTATAIAPDTQAPVNTGNTDNLTVPTDDSIEMVIIEEEGTY